MVGAEWHASSLVVRALDRSLAHVIDVNCLLEELCLFISIQLAMCSFTCWSIVLIALYSSLFLPAEPTISATFFFLSLLSQWKFFAWLLISRDMCEIWFISVIFHISSRRVNPWKYEKKKQQTTIPFVYILIHPLTVGVSLKLKWNIFFSFIVTNFVVFFLVWLKKKKN